MAKLKIQLNDSENIRDVLQEAYNLANEQVIQAQNEINKMASATKLQEESIDGKAKYGKIINDYLGMRDKAISKKIEIAKLLSDIMAHNGDLKNAGDGIGREENFNFDDIRKIVNDSLTEQKEEKTRTIILDKA